MDDPTARFLEELLARPSGPLALRFIIQPATSLFFAFRDGARDAKFGRPAYFWALFTQKAHRRELVQSGWRSISKLVFMGLLLDVVYQILAPGQFRILETIVIAAVLCVLPYVLMRGPINRLLRWFASRGSDEPASRKAA
ncbi:MAG TPA: hypothetical protein VGD49_14605 [Longimicrobiales bacterium]